MLPRYAYCAGYHCSYLNGIATKLTELGQKIMFRGTLNNTILNNLLGLTVCVPENEPRIKLLRLKLEALVRSGGEIAANQALETFSQVS